MPGEECPCTNSRSPGWVSDGARQKWLKPTSYRVAALAKLAMWPPRSPGLRLARTTVAIAFQRMIERSRDSMAASPGDLASSAGAMVLTYSVVGENRRNAPERRSEERRVGKSGDLGGRRV